MVRTRSTVFGISLPTEVMHKIDVARGDISRSRYLLRLIEKVYGEEKKEENSTTDHP